jgi:hypothetical protein
MVGFLHIYVLFRVLHLRNRASIPEIEKSIPEIEKSIPEIEKSIPEIEKSIPVIISVIVNNQTNRL